MKCQGLYTFNELEVGSFIFPNFRTCKAEAAGAKWSANDGTENRLVFDNMIERIR